MASGSPRNPRSTATDHPRHPPFDPLGNELTGYLPAGKLVPFLAGIRTAGHFSLGKNEDAPLLVALVSLEAVCGQLQAGERILGDRIRALVSAVRDFEFGRTPAELRPMPDAVREQFLELLDVLTSETALSNAVRDQVLSAVTDFCRETHFQVLPEKWSFEGEVSVDPNSPRGDEIARSAEAEQVVFHGTVQLGRRYVEMLGLAEADHLVRPPKVFRSAGTEPPEYQTLAAMLDDMASRCEREPIWESARRTVADLTQNLRDWPRRALTNELEDIVVFFHLDYRDKLAELVKREPCWSSRQATTRPNSCSHSATTTRETKVKSTSS